MYELKTKNKNSLLILFFIIILVVFFTIIAYTLFLDGRKYEYSQNVIGSRVYYQENRNVHLEEILESSLESVVGISKIRNTGTTVFLENGTESLNLGSGVIISKYGYILSNEHVSGEKYSTCYITLKNGVTDTGTVVWASKDFDLSIIKINIQELPEAYLGDSDNIRIGSNVYAVGNPVGFELQRTVTSGIISGTNRIIKIDDEENKTYLEGLIQTDATINQGNSGGPLINELGEVIGITTLKIEDAEGIGFAIPINIIKPILATLIETGTFEEAYLGLYGYDKDVIPYLSSNINFENGIYIEALDMQGPLKDSRLVKGDILEKIDGKPVTSITKLKEYIYTKKPGDQVTLVVKRNNKYLQVKTILGKK